jgi:hypothetical protein
MTGRLVAGRSLRVVDTVFGYCIDPKIILEAVQQPLSFCFQRRDCSRLVGFRVLWVLRCSRGLKNAGYVIVFILVKVNIRSLSVH